MIGNRRIWHPPEKGLVKSAEFVQNNSMALIFVIEDNESIREAVSGYLKLSDYEVEEFEALGGVV